MKSSAARLAGGILFGLAVASQSIAIPAAVPPSDSNHGWPRQFPSGGAALTVYQPQLDSWDGRHLQAHAAVSVRPQGATDSTFGVIWISAHTDVDKENRQVKLENIEIPRATFPSAPGRESAYLEMFRQEMPKRSKTIALDRLEASLAILEERRKSDALPLRNDPPGILFSKVPAILVTVDGPPVYRAVRATSLERVLNTRPLLLRDASGVHYLHLFDGWMRARRIEGPWSVAEDPPAELAKAADELARSGQPADLLEGEVPETAGSAFGKGAPPKPSLQKGPVPAVFVATSPTELLVTEGEPDWAPIDASGLLYVRNTTGNVFKDLSDQKTYVLISGRWYRASSAGGPWEYVPGGRLPAAFSKIPDDSPKENVKASVPGTAEAAEALIANETPQTARVDRKTQMTPPEYDGEPELAPIEGTPLQYVKNASLPVIVVDGATWYAVENGVWFVATSPRGPWKVADSVPAVIYSIPPSSPLHYVTYVRVYDAWEDAVWEGYTPGYTGTVIDDDGLVVYGTGYAYSPWVGSVWYGPPVTWGLGFGLAWTPWWGWSFGVGFGWGWGWGGPGDGWVWGCLPPPWWGPIGWGWGHGGWRWRGEGRQTRIVSWRPGGFPAAGDGLYRRWGPTVRVSPRPAPSGSPIDRRPIGIYGRAYNSRTGALAGGQRARLRNVYPAPRAEAPRVQPVRPRNDVYGDREGRVFRRDEKGSWRQVAPPSSRPPEPARVRPLEREHGAREMGERRSSGARAPAPRPSAPAPAPRPVAPRGSGRHR